MTTDTYTNGTELTAQKQTPHLWSTDVLRGRQLVNRERAVSSISGVGTSGHLQAKLDPYLTPYTKTDSKCIKGLHLRAKTRKLLD